MNYLPLEKYGIEKNCLHDTCQSCHGTGKKNDGTICIHMISCPCKKCSFTC